MERLSGRLQESNSRGSLSRRGLSGAKHIISGPVSNIFNFSVQEGVFPSKLKQAEVIPVYKSDDETEPGNYRPISLSSICNRRFEKLM